MLDFVLNALNSNKKFAELFYCTSAISMGVGMSRKLLKLEKPIENLDYVLYFGWFLLFPMPIITSVIFMAATYSSLKEKCAEVYKVFSWTAISIAMDSIAVYSWFNPSFELNSAIKLGILVTRLAGGYYLGDSIQQIE